MPRDGLSPGRARGGWYEEIFNSDSKYYGGSNMGNGPGVMAEDISSHGRPASIGLVLPPLAMVVLKAAAVRRSPCSLPSSERYGDRHEPQDHREHGHAAGRQPRPWLQGGELMVFRDSRSTPAGSAVRQLRCQPLRVCR